MINETLLKIRNYYFTNETKSYDFRIEQLKKLKSSVLKYKDLIINALGIDLRKPEFEVYTTEILPVLDEINYAIENLKDWMREETIENENHLKPSKTVVLSEPFGIVLIIVPFNYPFQLALVPLIGAIAAGNCAVLRITKRVPYISKILLKLISETFSSDYIKLFLAEDISSSELLRGNFDYIFFTGSSKTGAEIAKLASEKLIPYTLELGGKSPVIVDDTVDLELCAKRIIRAKLINSGQTCIAPDYVLAHTIIKNKLIDEFKKAIKSFYGPIVQESKDYSRIVDSAAIRRLDKLIKSESKNIVLGGLVDECGLFIEPTILNNITFSSPVMKEEIFGPILPIIEWNNKTEIINTLKTQNKPLALYIFSKDDEFIKSAVKNLSYGGGCINDVMMQTTNPKAPFGGVGYSGVGRYHGKYSFDTFSHKKTIFINNQDEILDILYPPYNQEKLDFILQNIT